MSARRTRVVVIGAGFGGLSATHALARQGLDVVLIDRSNHHLFQPLLYQVATAALDPSDIASPIRSIFARRPNVEVLLGEVTGIDAASRTVSVTGAGTIAYDHLVIATGAVPSWFGHDDWAEHSVGLKNLRDAAILRQRLLCAFERAETCTDPGEIRRLLTFVVVGGGASGVELAGSIRALADYTLAADFRRIEPGHARVVVFEGAPKLLAGFPERLSDYAQQRLLHLGVEVHTSTQVERVDGAGVPGGGPRVYTATGFWGAGGAATPAAAWLGLPPDRHGTLPVNADCTVPGHEDIFAIGDVAAFKGPDGRVLPGVAPVAKQQGRYVARVIAGRATGRRPPKPFRYRDPGSLAIVGRAAAVANLPHARLTGLPAWLIWACVHLVLLSGLRNRVMVYLQWFSAWLFYARGARVIMPAGRPGESAT